MSREHGERRRRDRGASLPEYALILSALALVSVGAVQTATSRTGDQVEGFEVTEGDVLMAPTTTTPSLPTTSVTPSSSTTLPSVTTTTTTAPPTTTTSTTTSTTAAVGRHVSVIQTSATWDDAGRSKWTATWRVLVTLDGVPVPGATVTTSITPPGGGSTVNTCTTGVLGQCGLIRGSINASRASATLVVTDVSDPWDGVPASSTIARPA